MPETTTDPRRAITVDLGVFAHNEADGIAATIGDLARQSLLDAPDVDLRIVVLANGCTDDTTGVARRAAEAAGRGDVVQVEAIAQGGKSRTWNRFVHDLSRKDCDVLLFCDADIRLPDPRALEALVRGLMDRPGLRAISSRPVKDLQHDRRPQGLQERLIASSGGGLDDWRTAICGQLYGLRKDSARAFHLPAGLPVEDGFVRAAVLTDVFSGPEDLSRIDGAETFHVYESERTIPALIRHQCRIVMGGAVNVAVFERLAPLDRGAAQALLRQAARDQGWLAQTLRAGTPRWPYGWVPFHFLVKRAAVFRATGGVGRRLRALVILTLGLGFDAVVFVLAQARMARGQGAGFW
jgi:hypothetical protein